MTRPRQRPQLRRPGAPPPQATAAMVAGLQHRSAVCAAWLLAQPAVLRAVAWLAQRPARLRLAIVLAGLLLAGAGQLALRQSGLPAARPAPAAASTPAATVADPVLATVAAYNQASIVAGQTGQVAALAPYLDPGGLAWQQVAAEYARRARRGEVHDATLVRWGVLSRATGPVSATLVTQEQWDDRTTVDGQLVGSRRGVIGQFTYVLRWSPPRQRWQITTIRALPVVE